jgi:hypothetical protein
MLILILEIVLPNYSPGISMRSIYDRSFGFLNSEQQVARHVGFMLG